MLELQAVHFLHPSLLLVLRGLCSCSVARQSLPLLIIALLSTLYDVAYDA